MSATSPTEMQALAPPAPASVTLSASDEAARKSTVDWLRHDNEYSRRSILASTSFVQALPPAQPSPEAFIAPARLLDPAEAAALSSNPTPHPVKGTRRTGKGVKGKRNAPLAHSVQESGVEVTTVKTCEAIDRWDQSCTQVVVGGHKGKVSRNWCSIHQAEELKVVDEFLECQTEVGTDDEMPTLAEICSSDDLGELEDMERVVQVHHDNCARALDYYDYHVKHFAAAGDLMSMLDNLLTPAELQKRKADAQLLLQAIIGASHAIILHSEDAKWLMQPVSTTPSPCVSTSPSPLKAPGAPSLQTEADEPDPLLAVERVQRAEVLELLSLTGSHASFIRDGRKSVERVRIVECLFRRLISRDHELLVKAYRGGHDHVLRFFEDPLLCSLPALRRLHAALQQTSSLSLREAITDAFRAIAWEESGAGETEEGEEGLGLQLLGGWVYKVQLPQSLSPREWNHLYDLNGCPGCAVRCCVRFQDLATIRRLTVCPAGPPVSSTALTTKKGSSTAASGSGTAPQSPPYESWGDVNESDSNRIMRALDIVRCAESGPGASEPETRRVGGGFVGAKGKGLWVERIERNWMFVKISNSHPRVNHLLIDLARWHVLVVRFRMKPSDPALPPSSHLWFYRHRSAPSKPELKHQAWSIDPDGFGTGNSDPALVLSTLDGLDYPEKAQGMPPFTEALEILILDGFGLDGEGTGRTAGNAAQRSFERFEAHVGLTMAESCGADGVKGAIEWGTRESYRRGDLLWDFNNPHQQQGQQGTGSKNLVGGATGGKSAGQAAGGGGAGGSKRAILSAPSKSGAAGSSGISNHTSNVMSAKAKAAMEEQLTVGVLDLVKGAFQEAGVDPLKAMEMGVEVEVRRELEALASTNPSQGLMMNGDQDGAEGPIELDPGVREKVASGVLNSLRDDQLAFKLSRSLFR